MTSLPHSLIVFYVCRLCDKYKFKLRIFFLLFYNKKEILQWNIDIIDDTPRRTNSK